ncbi:MAG: DUF2130 domain-containing protein [Nitrospinae bacterium]|nr:DUF2130 domain-containing protein [Nitrospinota bacterium]
MPDQTINCPYCNKEIPLTETLFHQVKENLRKEFEDKTKEKEHELAKREKLLEEKAKIIKDSEKVIEQRVSEKLKAEKEKLKQDAKKEAEADLLVDMKDLQEQAIEKDKKLQKAQETELELRKRVREAEEARKNTELEVARRMDQEKEQIEQKAIEIFTEKHRLDDLGKDKKIADMTKKIEDLERLSKQGSMQTQGEVLELDLEALLKTRFPVDEIEPVPKGIRGADILQKVYSRNGQHCGTIAWETKRTKAWSDSWISKLKDDQREVKAEIAVIVTETMPKDVSPFTQIEGVWITNFSLSGSLAEVLRTGLIQVSQAKLSAVGKNEKMEVLYNYLSGPEFKQKVEAIVETFKSMKEDLDQEKRAIIKNWAKREKQIERVITNTAVMYGDLQGIIGASLPQIKLLELEREEETGESFKDEEIT